MCFYAVVVFCLCLSFFFTTTLAPAPLAPPPLSLSLRFVDCAFHLMASVIFQAIFGSVVPVNRVLISNWISAFWWKVNYSLIIHFCQCVLLCLIFQEIDASSNHISTKKMNIKQHVDNYSVVTVWKYLATGKIQQGLWFNSNGTSTSILIRCSITKKFFALNFAMSFVIR